MLSLGGKFGELGGFEKVLSLFRRGLNDGKRKCSIHMLTMAGRCMSRLKLIGFKEKIAEDLYEKVRSSVKDYLKVENFRDSDIKETTLDELK